LRAAADYLRSNFLAPRAVTIPGKGIDGLALAVQEMFGLDPFCGAVFVFRAKRADRIKLLVWDQTGMVLVHKRLEGGKFVWPQVRDGGLAAAAPAARVSRRAGS
jgi:transposase